MYIYMYILSQPSTCACERARGGRVLAGQCAPAEISFEPYSACPANLAMTTFGDAAQVSAFAPGASLAAAADEPVERVLCTA